MRPRFGQGLTVEFQVCLAFSKSSVTSVSVSSKPPQPPQQKENHPTQAEHPSFRLEYRGHKPISILATLLTEVVISRMALCSSLRELNSEPCTPKHFNPKHAWVLPQAHCYAPAAQTLEAALKWFWKCVRIKATSNVRTVWQMDRSIHLRAEFICTHTPYACLSSVLAW